MFKNTPLLISIFFFSFCFSQNGKVVAIKDGDTIVVLDSLNQEHIIRVADIDCPERGQPFSAKAKEFVSAEVFGKKVSVQKKDTDRYGRIIGFVLYQGKNLSIELLKNGLAWHYAYYSDDNEMAELQALAKRDKIGLWAEPNPINPYEWRKGHKHISHLVEKSENKNLNEIECPLCKQNLSSDIEIIKSYTQQFNVFFFEFLKNIQTHFETIDNYKIESYLQKSEIEVKSLNDKFAFCKDYLSEVVQPVSIDFKEFEKIIKPLYKSFLNKASNKAKNPSETFEIKKLEDFELQLTEINNQISELNTKVVEYNKKIQEFKKTIKTEELAKQELNSLQQTKKRFEKSINDRCETLIKTKKKKDTLEKEYSDLAKQEADDANDFIKKYAVRINYYLGESVFETPFQIKEMKHGVYFSP